MSRKVTPLARSLEALHAAAGQEGASVLKSAALSRVHRERLLKSGFVEEIIRGWLAVNSRPGPRRRVDEAWSTILWEFARKYLADRFGGAWILSPESSVAALAGNPSIPRQVVVRSPKAGNEVLNLPGDTSFYFHRTALPAETAIADGLQVMAPERALVELSPGSWSSQRTDVVAVLGAVRGASPLLRILLDEGRSTIAGRMAGALRSVGRGRDADDIVSAFTAVGYKVQETDPFGTPVAGLPAGTHRLPPAATRIRLLWHRMRAGVLETFTQEPEAVADKAAYLASVDERYVSDAYNSLSIEGYEVSHELIERVRSGSWNSDAAASDRDARSASAARGYWLAFNAVKEDVSRIISGENVARLLSRRHHEWFRKLFEPSVAAGILKAHELAGYRGHPIYLRGSSHVPLPHGFVPDAIEVLFECIEEEEDTRVKAVVAPFLFTYIHPFHDGNGRIARFLMNALLAEGGFPWTIVPNERRSEYLWFLETASQDENIVPLARFVADLAASPPPVSQAGSLRRHP